MVCLSPPSPIRKVLMSWRSLSTESFEETLPQFTLVMVGSRKMLVMIGFQESVLKLKRSPTAIIHPKTSPNIDKSTFKCSHCNKTDPTSLDIPQFQSNDSWYNHENNEEPRDSKKTSNATVAEIKTEANVAEKVSVLVAATDHGDHTTFDSRQVSFLRPSSQKIVSTANGNTTLVIGEESLTLTDTLNLDSVLVVPSLDYNLLSVSQITAALSCIVIFWPEFCVIKDIQTRQTIGCGIKQGKLYYLDL
ncbi:hypothetical protein CK203_078816 [Vitis vinifera]|uniref:Uncharacterized protein n=1 Tax=Vitis vinifera TaxID=29760 RepID=A0A438FBW5_VITVI|nr:hypothetical protein CK203_078816 [Vitis vinifera]